MNGYSSTVNQWQHVGTGPGHTLVLGLNVPFTAGRNNTLIFCVVTPLSPLYSFFFFNVHICVSVVLRVLKQPNAFKHAVVDAK